MDSILDQIIARYREEEGNIITLLQDTQEAFGYIPKEATRYFSEQLALPASRIYGVATFYAQFRLTPIGKNSITTCCGTACHVRGAERILSSLRRELHLAENEDTTSDGKFTIEQIACLGFCSFSPVVLINGTVYGKTKTNALIKAIKALRKQ